MTKNRTTAETTLKDVLDQHKREIFLEMNCHAIGVIEKFDKTKQVCTVKIDYLKTRLVRNQFGRYQNESFKYPLLLDCPKVTHASAEAGISTPVKKGDSCLVLFNDRDLDNWYAGVKEGEVASNRSHSISDGIVIVGLRDATNSLSDYDEDNPHIWNKETRIKVKDGIILLENGENTLGGLLRELIDQIKSLTTTNAVPGSPSGINPASQALLEQTAVKIEGLLE